MFAKHNSLSTLGDKIKQAGPANFSKLKKLAFLDFSVRQDITKVLVKLGLDEENITLTNFSIKYILDKDCIEVKISSSNKTILAFLKTNLAEFEDFVTYTKYNVAKLNLKIG